MDPLPLVTKEVDGKINGGAVGILIALLYDAGLTQAIGANGIHGFVDDCLGKIEGKDPLVSGVAQSGAHALYRKSLLFSVPRLGRARVSVAIGPECLPNLNVFGDPRAVSFFLDKSLVFLGGVLGVQPCKKDRMLGRGGLGVAKEEVVQETVIAAVHKGDARHGGGMRNVIGGGAGQDFPRSHHAREDIVHKGVALGPIHQRNLGQKQVVIHRARPMRNLNVEVSGIVVIEILGDAGSLRLPIQPGAKVAAMVDVIFADHRVHGGVKLDASDLVPPELMLDRDVVDVVVLNGTEDTSHVSHNTRLTAIVDPIVAHDVRANLFLTPSRLVHALEDRLHLVDVPRLAQGAEVVVVAGGDLLAKADAVAFGIVEKIVLNDPPFAPMRADHTRLIGGGRCPGGGGVGHFKAAHRNIIYADLTREEAAFCTLISIKLSLGFLSWKLP